MKVIKLETGRGITLQRYYQQATYGDMLRGMPDANLNAELLTEFQTAVTRVFGKPGHMIEPRVLRDGPELRLPAVACAGDFCSFSPTDGGVGMASDLVLIWFQDDEDTIVSNDADRELRKVDWDRYARDFDW